MKKYIAERKLFYSNKGEAERKECCIRIGAPYQVEQSMVEFSIGEGVVGCGIEIVGLPEKEHDVYGVDSVQAINIASDLEALLERLQKNMIYIGRMESLILMMKKTHNKSFKNAGQKTCPARTQKSGAV